LLQALLALQETLLCLQQPLLRPLRPRALRLFRLQPLHALLQAIDAILDALLALYALARKDVALPVLHGLLPLDPLLITPFYPLLSYLLRSRPVGSQG
jgi:hypothetical protein